MTISTTIAIITWIAGAVLLFLWIYTGEGKYEPWFNVTGLIAAISTSAVAFLAWRKPLRGRLTLLPYENRTRGYNGSNNPETTITYKLRREFGLHVVPEFPYLEKIRARGRVREVGPFTFALPVLSCDVLNSSGSVALIESFIIHVDGSSPIREPIPTVSGSWGAPFVFFITNHGSTPMVDVSVEFSVALEPSSPLRFGPYSYRFRRIERSQAVDIGEHLRRSGVDVDYLKTDAMLDRLSARMAFAVEQDAEKQKALRGAWDQRLAAALGPLAGAQLAVAASGAISYGYSDLHGKQFRNRIDFDCSVRVFHKPTAPPPLQCTYDVLLREEGRDYETIIEDEHLVPNNSGQRFDFALAATSSSRHRIRFFAQLNGKRILLAGPVYVELVIPTGTENCLTTALEQPAPPDADRKPVPSIPGRVVGGGRIMDGGPAAQP